MPACLFFDFENLKRIAQSVPFVVLVLCADGASSNNRLKAWITAWAQAFNDTTTFGRILVLNVTCATHIVTRMVINTFKYVEVWGRSVVGLPWVFDGLGRRTIQGSKLGCGEGMSTVSPIHGKPTALNADPTGDTEVLQHFFRLPLRPEVQPCSQGFGFHCNVRP
jgi:hypothetical protein